MTYGIKVQMPNGITLDSSTISFCIADSFLLAQNQANGSKSYPELAGFTVRFYQLSQVNSAFSFWSYNGNSAQFHSLSANYSSGYPIVSWTLPSGSNVPSLVLVFAQ